MTTTGLEKEGLPDATGQRGARMQTGTLLLQAPCSSGWWNVLKLSFLPHSANLQKFFFFQDGDSFIGILILKVPHVQS